MDRDLGDEWLERLNKLETFSLVSICEGHINVEQTSVKRRPCIILRPKEAHLRPLTEKWKISKISFLELHQSGKEI